MQLCLKWGNRKCNSFLREGIRPKNFPSNILPYPKMRTGDLGYRSDVLGKLLMSLDCNTYFNNQESKVFARRVLGSSRCSDSGTKMGRGVGMNK